MPFFNAEPYSPAAMFPPPNSRLICLLASLLLAACASSRAPLIATDLDADRRMALRVGQSLVITLPADRSAGRLWALAQHTLETLALDGEPNYMQESGSAAAGDAPGSETWRFVAVRAGLDELRFEYRRPLEARDFPARVLRFRVTTE